MTDEQPVPVLTRLEIDTVAPHFSKALAHLDNAMVRELDAVSFDARLRELVRLRASQLNGCSYCVDLHSADALKAGPVQNIGRIRRLHRRCACKPISDP